MRLIDADLYADAMRVKQNECKKLIDEARKNNSNDVEYLEGIYATFVESKLTLDSIPTVDAVPVVRCKDCIYGTEMSGNIVCHQPKHNEYETDIRWFDWYCADGEPKEKEGNNE